MLKIWFLKIHDFIIFSGGTTEGVFNGLVYKFSVPDLKTSLSVCRKRKKEASWIQRRGQMIYASAELFSILQWFKKKRRCFPFTKDKYNCTSGGKKPPSFQHQKIPSQTFNHLQKSTKCDPPHPLKLVCLLHIPRKRVPQSPYIPTH